jgi:hypothetical protein
MGTVSSQAIAQFIAFVDQAKPILLTPRPRLSIAEFESFLEEAKPLAILQVRQALENQREQLKNVCCWLIPSSSDILAAAGLSGFENPYTNLIKWMLYPSGRPDLAIRCQRAWLKALNLPIAEEIEEAIEPQVQFVIDDGRADIVLHFQQQQCVVIIEAKTGTVEHETPRSKAQTIAYPPAVRRKLGLPADHPCEMIFLTQSGLLAADQSAINTTYDTLVSAIACELSPYELPFDLRWAYSTIITHLLTYAASGSFDKAEALRKLTNYLGGRAPSLTDEQIIAELATLGPICRALRLGVTR